MRKTSYCGAVKLSSFNPLRGLEQPRRVWAWGMYDLANQSFTLLINTLLFPVFFREVIVGAGTPDRAAMGDRLWSSVVAGSMLAVVIVSPLLGAMADARGSRKRFLIGTGLVCVIATCALGGLGRSMIPLAVALYVTANIAYQLGENFLASFLPIVSTQRNIGRVSAIGWTMGYIGALMLLAISLAAIGVFGLHDTAQWRPLIVFAGLWFLGGMIAPLILLPEPPPVQRVRSRGVTRDAVQRVRDTWRNASTHRELGRFLLAFFVYGMGVQTVIFFSAIIAKEVVFAGAPNANLKLVVFVAQLTVTAGIAAAATGAFQDRIGARTTVILYLVIWILSALGFAVFSIAPGAPEWAFWILGNGIGFGLGGIGTASRSMVGRFTPAHKTAEFFGLWGMVYKLASVVGVFAFGQTRAAFGDLAALSLLTAYFVVGLILTLRVHERRGMWSARRIEREARRGDR